jgi:hypothetical protein
MVGPWSETERPTNAIEVERDIQTHERAVAAERARCRAIVLRLFGNDWSGNQALEEIDGA